jgi:hypothetical protein
VSAARPATGGPGAAHDAASAARWRARVDALTQWCLSDLPLAPGVAGAVGPIRPTLGELLRRALGHDAAGVTDLLDALDSAGTPAARALIGRVLGGEILLVVVTVRGGGIVRADARACRAADEARALVDAYLGAPAAEWVATHGASDVGGTRGPALVTGLDGEQLPDSITSAPGQSSDDALTIVLPFLPLDSTAAAHPTAATTAPNPYALPAILGGTMRPGAAFLDAPALDDADGRTARPRRTTRGTTPTPGTTGAPTTTDEAGGQPTIRRTTRPTRATSSNRSTARSRRPRPRGGGRRARRTVGVPGAADDADAADELPTDHSLALGRLRARTTAAAEHVAALIATDDGVAEHVADARPWLAEASEQELRARAGEVDGRSAARSRSPRDDDPRRTRLLAGRRHTSSSWSRWTVGGRDWLSGTAPSGGVAGA